MILRNGLPRGVYMGLKRLHSRCLEINGGISDKHAFPLAIIKNLVKISAIFGPNFQKINKWGKLITDSRVLYSYAN